MMIINGLYFIVTFEKGHVKLICDNFIALKHGIMD